MRYLSLFVLFQVRAVLGPQAYMLTAVEELWEKPLRPIEEELLRYSVNTLVSQWKSLIAMC